MSSSAYERAFGLARNAEDALDELRLIEPTVLEREERIAVAREVERVRGKARALAATLDAWPTPAAPCVPFTVAETVSGREDGP